MAFSARTIFLFIRGVDQASRAIDPVDKSLRKLVATQRQLARTGYRMMFAGAAFTAFAYMAGRALFGLIENTSLGQLYLEDFTRVFDRLKMALGEAITDKFGGVIEGWIKKLDDLAKNETFMQLIAGLTVPAVITLATVGPPLLVGGFAMSLINNLAMMLVASGHLTAATAVQVGGGIGLALTVSVIITALVADWMWKNVIPEQIKEDIQGFIDKATETGFDFKLGPGYPRLKGPEGKPATMKEYLEFFNPGAWQMSIVNYFENIFTKADVEELPDAVAEGVRNAGDLNPWE